jgi:hypothetical protein
MPSAKKTPTPTTTTKKPARRRATKQTTGEPVQYVNISEHEQELREGSRATWAIVGFLSLIIVVFWFWTFKQSVERSTQLSDVSQFTQEINSSLAQWRDQFNQLTETPDSSATSSDLEMIKAAIIEQIETALGPEQWPKHSSEAMGISLKYPITWFKNEQNSTITLRSYQSATNTPEVLGQVTIKRYDNPTQASTESWMRLQPGAENYVVDTSSSTVAVAGQPILRYTHRAVDADDIHWLLYISRDTDMYEIDLFARNGRNIYEDILENIVGSITLNP